MCTLRSSVTAVDTVDSAADLRHLPGQSALGRHLSAARGAAPTHPIPDVQTPSSGLIRADLRRFSEGRSYVQDARPAGQSRHAQERCEALAESAARRRYGGGRTAARCVARCSGRARPARSSACLGAGARVRQLGEAEGRAGRSRLRRDEPGRARDDPAPRRLGRRRPPRRRTCAHCAAPSGAGARSPGLPNMPVLVAMRSSERTPRLASHLPITVSLSPPTWPGTQTE